MSSLRQGGLSAKWVRPENLHITLKFLGDVDPALVPELERALKGAARQAVPCSCRLTGLGTFPPRGRPRILYVATDQQGRLKTIAEVLEDCLVPCGFSKEGRFTSHITLARFRPGYIDRQKLSGLPAIHFKSIFQVAGFSLMESTLTPSGANYRDLGYFNFGHQE